MHAISNLGSKLALREKPISEKTSSKTECLGRLSIGNLTRIQEPAAVHYKQVKAAPISLVSLTTTPVADRNMDDEVNGVDPIITIKNNRAQAITLQKGLRILRDGWLWDRQVVQLQQAVVLEPHQTLVIVPDHEDREQIRAQWAQQNTQVIFATKPSLGIEGASYLKVIAPSNQEIGKLDINKDKAKLMPVQNSATAPTIGRTLSALPAVDSPELTSVPLFVGDYDSPGSDILVVASGTFTPANGGEPRRLSNVRFDSAVGELCFVQQPGEGIFVFELTASDGDNTTRAEITVTAKNENTPPTIAMDENYRVELGDGRIAIGVSIGDPQTPAADLVKMVSCRFHAADGDIRDIVGHVNPQGSLLTFTAPAPGSVAVTVVAVDVDGLATIATTHVEIRANNEEPVAQFDCDERDLRLGSEAVVIGVHIDDPNSEQRDHLQIEWEGVFQPDNGDLRNREVEVVGNNSGVRIDPTEAGSHWIRVTVTDPYGAQATDTVEVRVAQAAAPVLDFAPQWRLLADGSGDMAFPLPLTDSDTPLEDLSVKLDGVDLRWWQDGSAAQQYDQSGHSSIRYTGDHYELRTKIWEVSGDYTARLTIIDPDGNTIKHNAEIHVRQDNQPPQLQLPSNRVWRTGTQERVLPVLVTDADPEAATIEILGTFRDQDGAIRTMDVRQDESGAILFDPSGAEAQLGDYQFAVTVTDPHGASTVGELTVRVVGELYPPQISVPEQIELDAPTNDSTHVLDVAISDLDTPMEDVDVNVTALVRWRDAHGNEKVRDIYPEIEHTSEGVSLHIPVMGNQDTTIELQMEATDTSNQTVTASSVINVRLAAVAPVVILGGDREVAVQPEPVRIPVEIYDPNHDETRIDVAATFTAQEGGNPRRIEASLVQEGAAQYLTFLPEKAGTYQLTVTATESVTAESLSTTATLTVTARNLDEMWLRTPVWTRENEWSSGSEVESTILTGVAVGETALRANNLYVKGMGAFEVGHGPEDSHTTRTENHDSFDQAVAFVGLDKVREKWEELAVGSSFAEIVAAKSGKQEMMAQVNGMSDTNAYYSPSSESMCFGTSNGQWDLGACNDVVRHEGGHNLLDHIVFDLAYAGTAGAIHEGFADGQAAFLARDPEVSEDFGKVRGGAGQELRNCHNNCTTSNTSSEVHDRGQVYAGFFWEIGEYLHRVFTGSPRDTSRDQELLNQGAADQALMIQWSAPYYFGTQRPSTGDFIRSMHEAVTGLSAAGKLDGRIDVQALHDVIDAEADKRGIARNNISANSVALSPSITTEQAALDAALAGVGLDPALYATEKRGNSVRGPNGETISRYGLCRTINIGGKFQRVRIEEDHITVTRRIDGSLSLQMGTLPQIIAAAERKSPRGEGFIGLTHVRAAAMFDAESVSLWSRSLKKHAATSLRLLTGATKALRPHELLNLSWTHVPQEIMGSLARVALELLTHGCEQTNLVWRDGQLMTKVDLDTVTFYAPITSTGKLGKPIVESHVIID